jgi:hypothetical protein
LQGKRCDERRILLLTRLSSVPADCRQRMTASVRGAGAREAVQSGGGAAALQVRR